MQRAVILANGELGDAEMLRRRLDTLLPGAAIIAANGGSHRAGPLGLKLDLVIGDLDSIDPALRDALSAASVEMRRAPARKNETDLELALLYAVEQGAQNIVVVGALGGRLDMTLANILLLMHPRLRDVHVELWTATQTAWLIRPPGGDIPGKPGDTLSLIPVGGHAQGVTTVNLEYPLAGEVLEHGPARGVSNVLAAGGARVELREGTLLAIHTTGRA